MPKYYCDYCDTFLTHDSPSVRKTHCTGRKHKDNVKFYYQKWMEEQAQHLIDATTGLLFRQVLVFSVYLQVPVTLLAAFKAGKIASNPFATTNFAQPPPGPGMPRPGGFNQPPPGFMPPIAAGMPNFAPNFAPPNFSMPMRPPMK